MKKGASNATAHNVTIDTILGKAFEKWETGNWNYSVCAGLGIATALAPPVFGPILAIYVLISASICLQLAYRECKNASESLGLEPVIEPTIPSANIKEQTNQTEKNASENNTNENQKNDSNTIIRT